AYKKKVLLLHIGLKLAEEIKKLKNKQAEKQAEIDEIRASALKKKTGAVSGGDREKVKVLEEKLLEIQNKIDGAKGFEIVGEVERVLQLRDYAGAFEQGRMIEIPSVKQVIDEGLENMRAHQPFLLVGHLGSGKTENAKHMARLFMIENGVGFDPATETDLDAIYDHLEPEMFSGADEASVYDLVGKLKLTAKDVPPAEVATRVAELSSALATARIRGVPKKDLVGLIVGKGNVTETVFNYGPLGRAIKRGVPLIIDEINMIPPEVITRINDFLTKLVGQKVRLQENGEEEFIIKKGFAIIATCNLGAQYEGIKEVNAAFKSRWIAREVFYPEIEETYDLMIAALLRKDRVRLPPDFPAEAFDQLIDLAVTVREVQEIFSGRTEGRRYMAMASGTVAEQTQLKKTVVSTRDLMRKIIQPWRHGGFKESLDAIIARNILASEVFSSDDQKFLTEIFIRRGFFGGWTEKDLKKVGISGISQKELDTLQVQIATDEYRSADGYFDGLRDFAHTRSALVRDTLLLGTKKK
ncbi:TPA: hypothetical protein DEA21_03585, partial [Candidatus Uhrbacteria bacterium]|nr:hypothetical protein [Candidatus Uhrbacteria bacterium]